MNFIRIFTSVTKTQTIMTLSATLGFALDHQQSTKSVKSIHDKVNMRGFAEAFEAGYWGPFHKRESKAQGTHYRRMFRATDFNFYGA